MRLTPERLDLLIAAVRKILPLPAPADILLRQFFQDHHQLGQNDRGIIAEAVFGILRRRFFLEKLAGKATARELVLAYLTRFQGMNLRNWLRSFGKQKSNGSSKSRQSTNWKNSHSPSAEFPEWLVEKLQKYPN
ncbi:MAG: hypothetical protein P0107_00600 [Nitrosomonas sp.]|nr:hypothetical protein [Nitrosomonas sp.]